MSSQRAEAVDKMQEKREKSARETQNNPSRQGQLRDELTRSPAKDFKKICKNSRRPFRPSTRETNEQECKKSAGGSQDNPSRQGRLQDELTRSVVRMRLPKSLCRRADAIDDLPKS